MCLFVWSSTHSFLHLLWVYDEVSVFMQFQKKQYAMLSWFRCGKKGYGLQVLENTSEGKFLIEYVGEVIIFA